MRNSQNNNLSPIKVVGMGLFPLPGEKRRHKRAEESARRVLAAAEAASQRGTATRPNPSGGEPS